MDTIDEMLACFKSWEPAVRVLGNIRAQDAIEAIETLRAELAECREKCAAEAWVHYMDVCKKRGVSPDTLYHWCAADAIRTATRKGKEKP